MKILIQKVFQNNELPSISLDKLEVSLKEILTKLGIDIEKDMVTTHVELQQGKNGVKFPEIMTVSITLKDNKD